MNPGLHDALAEIVESVDPVTPSFERTWATGRRRERRSLAIESAVVAVVVGIVAFLVWPAWGALAAAPAPPAAASRPDALPHPSTILSPWLPQDALKAHRPMVAVIEQDGRTCVVDGRGTAWALPQVEVRTALGSIRPAAALSPDGRWVAQGLELVDLVHGRVVPLTGEGSNRLEPWSQPPVWAPDSSRFAVITAGTSPSSEPGVAVVDTSGAALLAPTVGEQTAPSPDTYFGSAEGDHALSQLLGFTSPTTVLAFPAAAAAASSRAIEWSVGSRAWQPVDAGPTTPGGSGDRSPQSDLYSVSPDGSTLAVLHQDLAEERWSVQEYPLPGPGEPREAGSGRGTASALGWQDGATVVTTSDAARSVTGGETYVRIDEVDGKVTSWRVDAFSGPTVTNGLARWRAELLRYAPALLRPFIALVLIAIGRRRAGLLTRLHRELWGMPMLRS